MFWVTNPAGLFSDHCCWFFCSWRLQNVCVCHLYLVEIPVTRSSSLGGYLVRYVYIFKALMFRLLLAWHWNLHRYTLNICTDFVRWYGPHCEYFVCVVARNVVLTLLHGVTYCMCLAYFFIVKKKWLLHICCRHYSIVLSYVRLLNPMNNSYQKEECVTLISNWIQTTLVHCLPRSPNLMLLHFSWGVCQKYHV